MSKDNTKKRNKKLKQKATSETGFSRFKLQPHVPDQARLVNVSTELQQIESRGSEQQKLFIRFPASLLKKTPRKRPRRVIEKDEDSPEEEDYKSEETVPRSENEEVTDNAESTFGRFRITPSFRQLCLQGYQRQHREANAEHYAQYQRSYRSSQNPEDRARYQREYRERRANQTLDEELTLWETTRREYEKAIKLGPTIVCVCCAGLFFVKNVSLLSKADMQEKWELNSEVIDAAFWTVDNNKFNGWNHITIQKIDDSQKYYFCENCKITIKKNKVPTIALMKNLHFPNKVECIEKMTRLEERLVAPRHFFQSIFTHKGLTGQYRSKGGIVNVPVTVDTTVNSLPRNLDSSNTLHVSLARKLAFKKDYIKGNVDSELIWEAANYLKGTELFVSHDITLAERESWNEVNGYNNSDENADDVNDQEETDDVDGTINNDDDNGAANTTTDQQESEMDCPVNVVASDSLIDNNLSIRLAPGEGRVPLSLIKDKDSDFLSFIKIFFGERLNGSNDISYSALTKSMARRFDRRAVNRADYLLYMDRKSQLLKMNSNINTILRKRKNVQTNNEAFTVKDVNNDDNVAQLLNKDQAFKTFSGIRSSPEYWKNQKKNCMAMIRQLGIPSIFVTVSAAETKWNELLVMLKKIVDDDNITEEQADTLTYNEKTRLIQSDPVTTARYFDHRFRELKKTWSKEDGPFGNYKVIEYFFRVEFQHRGSPHVHMLIWLENAPFLPDQPLDDNREVELIHQEICNFVDGIYTCSKVWDESPHHDIESKSNEETWKELLKTRQTHKHTSSCRRQRGGKIVCRFNIPFFPMKQTTILIPLSSNEQYSEEQIKSYKDMYIRIKSYVDDNFKTLADSNYTFEEFLNLVGVSNLRDYIIALRVNLKLNKIYLKRNPNEIMINNYSRKIISMFRSNMDIQYVLDAYACCAYILDYINKADRGMSKAMEEMYVKHKNDPDSSSFELLKSLAATYYNASEISAQEAAYNLLGIRMVESSTVTVFVPTSRPEARTHILKSSRELDNLPDDSTDCFVAGLIEHYVNRPDSLDGITLAQFASYYEISLKGFKKKSKAPESFDNVNEDLDDDAEEVINETNSDGINDTTGASSFGLPGKVFALKNDSGFIRRRLKQKVIRYYKSTLENDPQEYFRILLMLYFPWRDETVELIDVDAESVFNENIDAIVLIKNEFCKIDDATLDGYMSQLNEENNAPEDDDDEEDRSENNQFYDRANDFRRYTVDIDDSSEGDYHRSNDLSNDLNDGHSARNNDGNNTYLERVTLPDRLSKVQYEDLLSKLNFKQREYLMHVIDHVRYNRKRDVIRMFSSDSETVKTFEPFYHFVTGGAGVGKSMLIKSLYESLTIEFNRDRELDVSTPTVMLTAPTGKAAFNIKAQTIHGAFMMPVSQFGNSRSLSGLSPSMLHSISLALKDLQVLIIDEISMVGTTMFSWIDLRLKQIFDASLPFGGKSVIVLGDFNQLPPVASKPLYTTKVNNNAYIEMFGSNLWQDLFLVHKLEQIMRQRDDLSFAVALNNMAVGKMTRDDIQLFQSRVLKMTKEEMECLKNNETSLPHLRTIEEANKPICLFHSNNEVRRANIAILQNMETQHAISTAFDRFSGSGTGNQNAVKFVMDIINNDSSHQLNNLSLLKNLDLRIDARYMMTSNVDTKDGLVNGTTGYLKKIDFGTTSSESDAATKPMRIWIEFDDDLSGSKLRMQQSTLRQICRIDDDSKWTMIEPIVLNIYNHRLHNLSVSRKQFPIVPAEALTTHKSQGGTYKNVVVYDTGAHKMSRSLIYVACSRATKASGLVLICKNNTFVPPKPLESEKKSDLFKETQRQLEVKLDPTFAPISVKTNFRIISHNVQSLQAHINQIVNDHVYLSSDIILLNETWTLSTDNLEIPGFRLAAATHCPSNVRKALGSCCYVSNSLDRSISSYSKLFVNQGNNSSVSVSMIQYQHNMFCSIYSSPNVPTMLLLQALNYILDQDYINIVIAGDFNIDFQKDSSKKTALLEKLNQYGLKSSLPENITSTTKQNTFIDNIFTNQDIISSGRYISLTSYHEPLWLCL